MTTLTISQIFEKFSFYQENYLSILKNSEQYHIEIEQAYLDVWPFSEKKLYLGDLLQLWFSEKWLINSTCRLLLNSSTLDSLNSIRQATQNKIQRTQDLYLFQLSGSTLSGSNHAQVWSVSEQKVLYVSLNSIFKYYCYFESIERPKNYPNHQFKTFGQAI